MIISPVKYINNSDKILPFLLLIGLFSIGMFTGIIGVENKRKLHQIITILFFLICFITILLIFLPSVVGFLFFLTSIPFFSGYLSGRIVKLAILQYRYFKLIGDKEKEKGLIRKLLTPPFKNASKLALLLILCTFVIISSGYYCIKNPQEEKSIVGTLGYVLLIVSVLIGCIQGIYKVLNRIISKKRGNN